MHTYSISDEAETQYRGCGTALAAIVSDVVVAIRYVRDIAPDIDDSEHLAALDLMMDPRLVDAADDLAGHGDVVAAMCSCCEVVELATIKAATSPPLAQAA